MQASLFANLTSLTLSSSLNGGALAWPRLVAGSDLTLSLRWAETIEGRNTEVGRTLTALKASLGRADARPVSGGFRLHLGGDPPELGVNLTGAIPFDASAPLLQATINELPAFDCVVTDEAGTFRIRLNDGGSEVEASVLENTLRPVAFVEWTAVAQNGEFIHELRMTQTPVAQTVDWALVAAKPPAVERIQTGGSNEDVEWNEIQKLTIPPDFRGTFQLRRGYRKSALISLPTSAEDIAAALLPLADADGALLATEIQDGALIEFSGSMGGIIHELLDVEVIDQAPGDPTFTLRTGTAEAWSLLSQLDPRGELRLPLEIKVWLADPEDDEPDKTITFKQEVIITAPVDASARNAASEINWNQPRGRRSLLPFAPGQVIIGHRSYQAVIGDGVSTSFSLNHNLDAAGVQVVLRENTPGGRLLSCPLEYNAAFESNNSLVITPQPATIPGGVLAPSQWIAHLTTLTHPASYQEHGHLIGEIDGLRAELDALGAAVSGLTSLVPTGALTVRDTPGGTPVAQWVLPPLVEAYPTRARLALEDDAGLMDIPPAALPRDGGLVPAVHAASATDVTALPADPVAGALYRYTGTDPLTVAGGLGRRAITLLHNEHLGWDGRVWFRVNREDGDTTTWYPSDFERELFLLAISGRQLIAKRQAELKIGLEVALRSIREREPDRFTGDPRNVQAQWVLVIEHGAFTAQASPATTDLNLAAITWDPAPILLQRLIVTRNAGTHQFGVRIKRAANGDLSTDAIYYGASEAGGSVPAAADFALRGRLCRFDIIDGVPDPRGLLLVRGLNVSIAGDDDQLGKLIIR